MGLHRAQKQKLEDLQTRLHNGEQIKNRDTRAAFGKEDYAIYEQKLEAAKQENNLRKRTPQRTKAQRSTEKQTAELRAKLNKLRKRGR